MRMPALSVTGAFLVAAALIGSAAVAHAQARRGPAQGYVTADSHYGKSSVTAPVRTGPVGRLEVRLPGGTWLECGRSCSDTLRRETVDFWYDRADPRRANGPGYITFGF